jgi:uncharacterized protein (DUF1810 family)
MDINSLDRFVKAQENTYETALNEIKNGKKETHWMWFIFPQLRGLGMSSISRYYGIEGIEEARAYLKHPVLSGRLYEACNELIKHQGKSALEIFGDIDEMKLKSSMTLFSEIAPEIEVFDKVLEIFFSGKKDNKTLELLK